MRYLNPWQGCLGGGLCCIPLLKDVRQFLLPHAFQCREIQNPHIQQHHLLCYLVFFNQMSEMEQGCGIGSLLFAKVNAHEFSHSLTVIDSIFKPFVRKAEPRLKQIHPRIFSIPLGGRPRLSVG